MKILRPILLAVAGFFVLDQTVQAHYDPNIGRWISRDPIGEEGGDNLYAVVSNNPVNAIDPFGLAENRFDDLGKRERYAHTVYGGKTGTLAGLTTKKRHGWSRSEVVKEEGKYRIEIEGVFVEGEYWWSSERTRLHEKHHTDLWTEQFQAFEDSVKRIRGCKKRVDCYRGLLTSWALAYDHEGLAVNLQYDCEEYGSRYPTACRKAAEARAAAKTYWDKFKKEMEKYNQYQ